MKHLIALSLLACGSSVAMGAGAPKTDVYTHLDANPPIHDDKQMVRFGIGGTDTSELESEDISPPSDDSTINLTGGIALSLDYSRQIVGPLFWELSFAQLNSDVNNLEDDVGNKLDYDGSLTFNGVGAGISVHPMRDKTFSPYAGITIGAGRLQLELQDATGREKSAENKLYWSAKVGGEFHVYRRFYIGAEYRVYEVQLDERDFGYSEDWDNYFTGAVMLTGRGSF